MSEPISINVAVQATQEPVLASPTTGDASPIDLTFVITYPGKPSTSVSVSRVEIEIPFGDDARALSVNPAGISTAIAIDPNLGTWRQDTGYDRGFAFITEDDRAISFTDEHSLEFTLKNVIVNREAGVVPISLTLSVKEGIQKITTATVQTTLSKMPYGFFLGEITTVPENATIHPGDSITLSWSGSSNANYQLYIDDGPPITEGITPVCTYIIPKESIPAQTFNVTLEAFVTISGDMTKYERHRTILVKPPLPEIISFTESTQIVGDKFELTLKWDTNHATSCEITGDPYPVDTKVDTYKIIPSVDNPLLNRYTLTAINNEGRVSQTLLLTWQASPFPIPVGKFPTSLCMTPDGSCLFVANHDDNTVTVIDVKTCQVQGMPFSVGRHPTSLCMTPDGSCLFVANSGDNTVTVIDVKTCQVRGMPILVGDTPTSLCMTPDGSCLFVATTIDGKVAAIDVRTRQVNYVIDSWHHPPFSLFTIPDLLGITPDGFCFFVADFFDNTVTVKEINIKTRQVQSVLIPVGGEPTSLCMTPDGSCLFVANLYDKTVRAIDVKTRQVQGTPFYFSCPHLLYVTPDGSCLFVATTMDGKVAAIDIKTSQMQGTPIPVGKGSSALCMTPDGSCLFVANSGDNTVSVLIPSQLK